MAAGGIDDGDGVRSLAGVVGDPSGEGRAVPEAGGPVGVGPRPDRP
jgi:hypothetical protein